MLFCGLWEEEPDRRASRSLKVVDDDQYANLADWASARVDGVGADGIRHPASGVFSLRFEQCPTVAGRGGAVFDAVDDRLDCAVCHALGRVCGD